MTLLLHHPALANRDCQHCLEHCYDEETGKVEIGRDSQPEKRLLNSGIEFLAPCRDPKRGCPKGTAEEPKTLWPENEVCYEHYQECKAVGQWPDDPLVRRNAAALREVETEYERSKDLEMQLMLMKIVAAK